MFISQFSYSPPHCCLHPHPATQIPTSIPGPALAHSNRFKHAVIQPRTTAQVGVYCSLSHTAHNTQHTAHSTHQHTHSPLHRSHTLSSLFHSWVCSAPSLSPVAATRLDWLWLALMPGVSLTPWLWPCRPSRQWPGLLSPIWFVHLFLKCTSQQCCRLRGPLSITPSTTRPSTLPFA